MNLGNVQFWWFLWDFYKRRVVLIIARRVEYLIGGILVLGHHSIGPSGLFFRNLCSERYSRHRISLHRQLVYSHIRQPSLMLECRSLMPTRTRRYPGVLPGLLWLFSLILRLSTLGDTDWAPLIIGTARLLAAAGVGSRAKTSTIHSYQTLRSSV